jgi:seryl-tRNA synthetase
MNTIDYGILAKAQQLYAELGYQVIEVPWRVSVGILEVTKPAHVKTDYVIEGTKKALIASGEQGFMYLMNKGILPPGKYQTTTPCFRNESYDITHSKQFMKLELIEVLPNGVKDHKLRVEQVVQHAKSVFTMLMFNYRIIVF